MFYWSSAGNPVLVGQPPSLAYEIFLLVQSETLLVKGSFFFGSNHSLAVELQMVASEMTRMFLAGTSNEILWISPMTSHH